MKQSIHPQTGPSLGTPAKGPDVFISEIGMTRSSRGILAGFRKEFLDLVDAIVQSSAVLLADAQDQEQERFGKDLEAIHASGVKLREQATTFFDLDGVDQPGLLEAEKVLRHGMNNGLNVIINYCEEWIEDSQEEFLEGFLADLQEVRGQGKELLALLNRIRTLQQGECTEAIVAQETVAATHADLRIELLNSERPHSEQAIESGYCLVVDDNPHNRDILTRLLRRQGHQVETAIHGREALEKIERESFDLVLLDIMMPEMNGFQVLQHLKANPATRSLPVIMISALDDTDSVVRCIGMGAEDYLPRPFNPLLLRARIGACLEKKHFQDREKRYLRQIEDEKQRSDELLHVILPNEIVKELKATKEVKPRRYDNVAVLFADLVGFTSYCDVHSPEEVVLYLQNLVQAWENIALRHGVEKIKTIGDAFMAASGLLLKQDNPVLNCVRCGLEMIAATQALPQVKWNLRVGIHVGPVVAGVIGQRQYLFDLWGDTVNTAARMESNGLPGRITLTEEGWQRISHRARGERAQVAVKGKGDLAVYRLASLEE